MIRSIDLISLDVGQARVCTVALDSDYCSYESILSGKNNHSNKKVVRIECVLIILSIVSALQTLKDNYEFIIFFNLFRLLLTCFGNSQNRGCKTAVPRTVPQVKIC